MSAAQSDVTLADRVGALQCLFTWDLDSSRDAVLRLKDKLSDMGTEEENPWLGHLYNVLGYIEFHLGSTHNSRRFFKKAAEVLCLARGADEGPWLVVNYGSQAWLHHREGAEEESRALLSKVDALMEKYPTPPEEELQAEVCAEKAWTLLKFSREQKLQAFDLFQRAIRMQPDRKEWRSFSVVGLVDFHKHSETQVEVETLREAKEKDPENLYVHVLYLTQLAKENDIRLDEARNLAPRILKNAASSSSGFKPILRFYQTFISIPEALDLAEEALKLHPENRFVKSCLALAYKWRILFMKDNPPKESVRERGIRVHQDVISRYPHSSLQKKIDLANIYAKSWRTLKQGDRIYQELLAAELNPEGKQILYNCYAMYLTHDRQQFQESLRYHKMAVEIPLESFYRQSSINALRKNQHRDREISKLLSRLKI